MKVIVIPDGYSISTIDDNGEGCKDCLFEVLELKNDSLTYLCGLDPRTRMPCTNTKYAVIKDVD